MTKQLERTALAQLTLPFEHQGEVRRYSNFERTIFPVYDVTKQFEEPIGGGIFVTGNGSTAGIVGPFLPEGVIQTFQSLTVSLTTGGPLDILLEVDTENINAGTNFQFLSRVIVNNGNHFDLLGQGYTQNDGTIFTHGRPLIIYPGQRWAVVTLTALAVAAIMTVRWYGTQRTGMNIGQVVDQSGEATAQP